MLLCDYCIEAIRSRGEKIAVVNPFAVSVDDCELHNEENAELIEKGVVCSLCCEWCGEENDLHECDFV